MALQIFVVFTLIGIFGLNTLFVNLSVKGAGTLSCTAENNHFNCASNNLTSVPDTLDNSLESVNLTENAIETIGERDFAGLTNLRTLTLSENRISNIEDGSFSDLMGLNTLYLDKNRLISLKPSLLIGLGNLQALLLDYNVDLSIDPCVFSHLVNLSFVNLLNTKVDLNAALITAKVTCPSPSFPYVENLKSLSIGYKGTSSNASILQHFSSLDVITLSGFSKASFSNSNISTLPNLKTLTLINVDTYPKEFLNSSSLTELTITESTFRCLPKNAFYNLPALKKLVIIRNSLVFIDREAFTGASGLTFINLAFNDLASLPQGIFDELGNLTFFPQINVHTNLWHCDCKIKWMQTFKYFKGKLLFCETPRGKKGTSIFSVNLECDSESEELTSRELKEEFCPPPGPEVVATTPKKGNTVTKAAPSNKTSVSNQTLTYIAAAGAVILISLIIVLIIAIVIVNRRLNNASPPGGNSTYTSDDNFFTSSETIEVDNGERLYDLAPAGCPTRQDIFATGAGEQGLPPLRNYVEVESRHAIVSPPGCVNTRHGRLGSTELMEAMASMGNGVERTSDRPNYVNAAPRNPPPRLPPL